MKQINQQNALTVTEQRVQDRSCRNPCFVMRGTLLPVTQHSIDPPRLRGLIMDCQKPEKILGPQNIYITIQFTIFPTKELG